MKNTNRAREAPAGDITDPTYLLPRPRQENRTWNLWYRLASPPHPGSDASFAAMERFRRGRTGSQILPAMFFLLLIAWLARFVGTSSDYLPLIILGSALLLLVATLFNHRGHVNVAGTIVVLTFILFPVLNIVTTPDGVGILELPLYSLLILPLVCAASFLPPWWVFAVALGNSLFTWASLSYLPLTAELHALLAIALVGTMTPIILSQILVSVVAYAWVRGTQHALLRADNAEQIARLEHDMALAAEKEAKEKKQLENSVKTIMDTHAKVANGDFGARVPLTDDNKLWSISVALNNLLNRLQRWHRDALELAQLRQHFDEQHLWEEKQQRR